MRLPSVFEPGRLIVVAIAAATAAACWLTVAGGGRPVAAQPAGEAGQPPPPAPVGAGGCTSSNCHGQLGSLTAAPGPDTWRSSGTIWSALDPHANATAVLDPKRNETAKRMLEAFQKTDANFNPMTDTRCLACHSNPSTAGAFKHETGLQLEGIGCEGCHGNAERWQVPHTIWPDAAARTAGAANTGLTNLNDIAARAKQCAGCHVGSPADPARGYPVRDMNHDMIAAGHPRLLFDYPSHVLRLPKHWHDKDRTQPGYPARPKTFEISAWVIGELAAAEAQCELTVDRATRANPWPELAEFNCYSCHHALIGKTWRVPATKPGQPRWDLPWPAAELIDELSDQKVSDPLGRMNEMRLSGETAGKVLAAVRAAQKAAASPPAAEAAILKAVQKLADPKQPMLWDDAYRAYLALNALEYGRGGTYPNQQQVRDGLQKLAEALFLPMHPSEVGFKEGNKERKQYTPDDVKKLLGEIAGRIKS